MRQFVENGSRYATVRPELETLVDGVAFAPQRADHAEGPQVLERDGAVVLTGYRPEPASLVLAAAEVLGTRLRHIQPLRTNDAASSDGRPLHNEDRCQVVDVRGRLTDLYGPDADYLLLLCALRSTTGGTSVVADGYRLVDRIREGRPDLWTFLTQTDVDRIALHRHLPDIPTTPSVSRHVEYTHTGRRIVRAGWSTQPIPRDPHWDEHERMLELYADIWTTLTAVAPRVTLEAGEILFIDNYRCLHGVDPWETRRVVHSLTVRSADAR